MASPILPKKTQSLKICCIDQCDNKQIARGMCKAHYTRWNKTGNPIRQPTLPEDLSGRQFQQLEVLGIVPDQRSPAGSVLWRCRCLACGNLTKTVAWRLKSGHMKTCGCSRIVHGKAGSRVYLSYQSALARCTNPKNKRYAKYGGRGIEFRFTSFVDFLEHIGERPEGYALDRIDNNGHYEAGNVQWATPVQQNRNKSNNHLLTVKGETKTLAEWGEIRGIRPSTLLYRIQVGWCAECATTLPVNINHIATNVCIHRATLAFIEREQTK